MTPLEKWMLWVSTAVVAATGIALGWMKYFVSPEDPYAVIHHPWQPAMLKIHLVAAPFLVFALGMVFTRHVVRQWASGRPAGRASGVGLVVTLAPMVISGYLIQVTTSESWLFRAAMLHVAASLLYLAGLAGHQVAAWRAGRRASYHPARREP